MILLLAFLVREVRLSTEPSKGLLIVGNWCDALTTELWGPDGTQCMLQNLSSRCQTLNVLENQILACYDKSCDELTENGFMHRIFCIRGISTLPLSPQMACCWSEVHQSMKLKNSYQSTRGPTNPPSRWSGGSTQMEVYALSRSATERHQLCAHWWG